MDTTSHKCILSIENIYIYIYHHLVIKPRHSPPPQHILEPRNCTMWLGNKQHGWNWDDHSLSVIRGAMWNPTGTKNSQRRSCLGRLGRSCDHFSWNFCILKIPGQTDLPQIRNDGQCTLLILYYPILIYLKAVSRFFSMSWIWECSPLSASNRKWRMTQCTFLPPFANQGAPRLIMTHPTVWWSLSEVIQHLGLLWVLPVCHTWHFIVNHPQNHPIVSNQRHPPRSQTFDNHLKPAARM